jgi:hypothetical protein
MKVTRIFSDDGISFDAIIKSMMRQEIEKLIDAAIFDSKKEGILGGTEDGNEASEL